MNKELFELLPPLFISGVWIGLAVFLTVQAFKYAKLFAWEWLTPPRLALISSGGYSLMWVAIQVDQQLEPWSITIVVNMLFMAIVGALVAALFYGTILKPLLEKLGVDGKWYRNQDLSARLEQGAKTMYPPQRRDYGQIPTPNPGRIRRSERFERYEKPGEISMPDINDTINEREGDA